MSIDTYIPGIEDGDFLHFEGNYSKVDQPEVLLNGCGTINPETGQPLSLYKMGVFAHDFEISIATLGMNSMYHLVGALLDEYQEEVLDLQNIIREEDIGFGACCFKCRIPNSDTCRLMQCGGCKIAMYCSKDCQKKHYKSHKKHCRKLKIIDKIGSSWYLPGTKSHTDAKLKEAATSLSQGPPLQGPVLPTDAVDEQDGGDIGPVGGEI